YKNTADRHRKQRSAVFHSLRFNDYDACDVSFDRADDIHPQNSLSHAEFSQFLHSIGTQYSLYGTSTFRILHSIPHSS
ncbi:MAG: hypothetical protein ACI4JQ_08305, partial [Ruminococcus sp.]